MDDSLPEVADRDEILRLLTESARKGSVSAQKALWEILTRDDEDDSGSEFDELDNVTPLRPHAG